MKKEKSRGGLGFPLSFFPFCFPFLPVLPLHIETLLPLYIFPLCLFLLCSIILTSITKVYSQENLQLATSLSDSNLQQKTLAKLAHTLLKKAIHLQVKLDYNQNTTRQLVCSAHKLILYDQLYGQLLFDHIDAVSSHFLRNDIYDSATYNYWIIMYNLVTSYIINCIDFSCTVWYIFACIT